MVAWHILDVAISHTSFAGLLLLQDLHWQPFCCTCRSVPAIAKYIWPQSHMLTKLQGLNIEDEHVIMECSTYNLWMGVIAGISVHHEFLHSSDMDMIEGKETFPIISRLCIHWVLARMYSSIGHKGRLCLVSFWRTDELLIELGIRVFYQNKECN